MTNLFTNLIQSFFRLITGDSGANWLSSRFYRWRLKKRDKDNSVYIDRMTGSCGLRLFKVAGAGFIGVEPSYSHTGRTAGLGFSVDWGEYGMKGGGVLGITEAKRLAHFILEQCGSEERNEMEIIRERDAQYYNYLQERHNLSSVID